MTEAALPRLPSESVPPAESPGVAFSAERTAAEGVEISLAAGGQSVSVVLGRREALMALDCLERAVGSAITRTLGWPP